MGALTFPGEMKGCWGLKEAAHAAEMACHNTRWIKEHGGREKREVYEEALFFPSVFTCHKVTSTDLLHTLLKSSTGEVAKLIYFV